MTNIIVMYKISNNLNQIEPIIIIIHENETEKIKINKVKWLNEWTN